MDPSSIALVVFSSALVVGSLTTIIAVNFRRCCIKPEPKVQDWVVTENVTV
jgi:hypothetical protein